MMARADSLIDRLLGVLGFRRIPLETALVRLEAAVGRAGSLTATDEGEGHGRR